MDRFTADRRHRRAPEAQLIPKTSGRPSSLVSDAIDDNDQVIELVVSSRISS
jgi:hypothetical protein